MEKHLESFVGSSLPEFIQSDHPQFRLFVEAYYEWMEKQNDSETNNVKQLFRKLENPGAVVNNAPTNRDVDETIDAFLDYFKKEVVPIAIDVNSVTDPFFIKKVRDVYLSKGTPKSFQLLFRLLYNEEIDIFETRDQIIEASEGKFLNFPIATVAVVGFEDRIDDLNFTLARLTHSDDGFVTDSDIGTVLNSQLVGTIDSDAKPVLQLQVSETIDFQAGETYRVIDVSDQAFFIEVIPTLSIQQLTQSNKASGYKVGGIIKIKGISSGLSINALVDAVSNGPVTDVFIRDRGEFFTVGDSIRFSGYNTADGSGGFMLVTGTDGAGRLTELDGIQIRTGGLNNGYLSDNFEDVTLPVANGGTYSQLPKVTLNTNNTQVAAPYGEVTNNNQVYAQGAQITPISTKIGRIVRATALQRGFFLDENDIEVVAPMNVVVEGFANFPVGQVVSFQKFVASPDAFKNDSERVDIRILAHRVQERFDSDSDTSPDLVYKEGFVRLPFNFDSELFQFYDSEYPVDSELGLLKTIEVWRKDVDDRFSHEVVDSDSDKFEFRLRSSFFNSLDNYHWNQLNFLKRSDSDIDVKINRDLKNIHAGIDSEVGVWVNTGFFGVVTALNDIGNVVSIQETVGKNFPRDSDLLSISAAKNTILRLAAVNPSNEETQVLDGVPNAFGIATFNRAEFDVNLSFSGETNKTFLNEDGFLDSLSGGVIQDNLFYSNYTYIVQTNIPINKWREAIKTTLHPAGMILIAETNITQPVNVDPRPLAFTQVRSSKSYLRFADAQDHYQSSATLNFVSADNTRYESNAFLFYKNTKNNMNALLASSFENGEALSLSAEYGNSWWDFEPLGLVRTEFVRDSDDFYGEGLGFYNFDWRVEFPRKITTQDSDGTGFVAETDNYYKKFDGTKQDFYKNDSRMSSSHAAPYTVRTNFYDATNEIYSVYDSEIPPSVFIRWTDSEGEQFQGIDYSKLRNDVDTRVFKNFITTRKKEITLENAKDFNLAMRLDGSLTFEDSDGKYIDFDAYERKWNEINGLRQRRQGWEVNGFAAHIQNIYKSSPRLAKGKYADWSTPDFRKLKTPYNEDTWGTAGLQRDSENIIWHRHYDLKISDVSETDIFDNFFANDLARYQSWRDPSISMKTRK